MKYRLSISDLADDLALDGSLRDLYVLDTDATHWDAAIPALLRMADRWAFTIDGEPQELSQPSEILTLRPEAAPLLEVSLGSVNLHCHFFAGSEIEFDFRPESISGQPELDRLLDAMECVADAVDRPVVMTHENLPAARICEVRPASRIDAGLDRWVAFTT